MKSWRRGVVVPVACLIGAATYAGEHTWDVWEVYSNLDGTQQFIELRETNGGTTENGVNGNVMLASPSGHTFTIPAAVVGNTAGRSFLIATPGFAALPGSPVPDAVMPPGTVNFIGLNDTSVAYQPWDTAGWPMGTLPRDGVHSLTRTSTGSALTVADASPTNFAGAGFTPPGEPGLTASRLTADGTSISVGWDTGACFGEADHQIIYGNRSNFPALAGGNYTLQGGTCDIGTAAPYTWAAPSAADGSGLLWFLVLAEDNAGTEGSWGKYDATSERNGSGSNGSSGVCSITKRDLTNTCGH